MRRVVEASRWPSRYWACRTWPWLTRAVATELLGAVPPSGVVAAEWRDVLAAVALGWSLAEQERERAEIQFGIEANDPPEGLRAGLLASVES